MPRPVRPVGEALPGLVVGADGVALGDVGGAGGLERALLEAPRQAVLGHGAVLEPAQRQVGERPRRHAPVRARPVAAKVRVGPQLRGGQRADVGRLVPVSFRGSVVLASLVKGVEQDKSRGACEGSVRHASGIAALVLDQALVGRHVVSVERQESTLIKKSD